MKLEELNKQIKSGALKSLYFFYGEEQYLLKNKINAIEKKLITPGTEDFNRFYFEGKKLDIEAIIETAEQFPQMSERKVVVVKNSGFLNNANSREYKRICEYSNDLPEYTCLIFVEESFDKKKEKNLKLFEENGGVVDFAFMPVNKVEVWIEDSFKKADKQIAPKEVSYMVRLCGQSLGKLQLEIQKLLNYVGDRYRITREDIDNIVDQTVEYRVYDMLDNMIAGRSAKAREQLKYLKDTKEQPTVVLGIMVGKLSELLMCKLLKESGMQAGEIAEYFDFKRPMFVVNKTIEESKRYGEPYLKRMIKKGLEYDASIKNGQMEGWTAAELYLSELIK